MLSPGGGSPAGSDLRHSPSAAVARRSIRASRAVSPSFASSSVSSGSPSSGTSASTNGSNCLSRMLVSANRAVPDRTDAAVSAAESPTAVIIPAPTTTTLSAIRLRGLQRRCPYFIHTQRLFVAPERRSPDQHDPVLVGLDQDRVEIRRDRLGRTVEDERHFDPRGRELEPEQPGRGGTLYLDPLGRLEVARRCEPRRGELEEPRVEVLREIRRPLLLPPGV